VRAQPPRLEHRHRRAHPIGARHVAAGQHDPALAAADDHRLVGKRGVVALLDRGIEGVAINVRNRERVKLAVTDELWRPATRTAHGFARHVAAAVAAEAGWCKGRAGHASALLPKFVIHRCTPDTNFGSKGALALYASSAALRFEVPNGICC
jgi:hypothetical protein